MSRFATFVFLAMSVLALAGCSRPEPAPPALRAVRTVTLTLSSAHADREFAADVRARHEARLGMRVGGKLAARHVELGQAVRAGQLLAELDPQDLRLAASASEAAVQAAQVAAAQAKADVDRFRNLQTQGFISEAELQRRESALRSALAQLAQAQAQAAVQANQSGYSRLLAPADGVVTAVLAEPASVLQAGQAVLVLALSGPRDAVFHVPEDRVDAVRALVGRPSALEVRLWGRPEPIAATVRELAASADPATRTFLVKAELGGDGVELGRSAVVVMPGEATEAVMRLPLPAVFLKDGQTVVWALEPGSMTVHAKPVDVAGADGNDALVRRGLTLGQEVVTAGAHVLSEGQKVTRFVAPTQAAAPAAASAPGQ